MRYHPLICLLLLTTSLCAQSVGQYEIRKRGTTGYTSYGVTLANGQALGQVAGVPAAITIGGGGIVTWGTISGTLTDQTDLSTALNAKLSTSTAASTYEPIITAGTTSQYWRGDKSWQTLNASAVGLGNVENTALSTWAGSTNLTTLGTVSAGTWNGSIIAPAYLGTGASITTKFLRGDGTWQTISSGGAWGTITGTLSDQTDLQTALNAKLATTTAASTYQPLNAVLTALSGLANAGGVLVNGGSGTLEWLDFTTGQHAAADTGKIAQYGIDGALSTGDSLYFSAPAVGGGYDVARLTIPSGVVGFTWTLPSTEGTLALFSQITVGNLAGLGTGVEAALAVNIGSAGATVLFNGDAGTPSAIVLTNASGTAASLTSGYATAARGLQTSSTTVSVSSATAPTSGQVLKATSTTNATWQSPPVEIVVACSDETTALTAGTAKVTFRMPHSMTLSSVRLSVNTAPTGAAIVVDLKESGTTVFSTKPQIAASAFTSVGGAVPGVISDTSLADDADITINLDQVGATIAGKGLKVTLIGTR